MVWSFGFILGSFCCFCAPVSSRRFYFKLGELEGGLGVCSGLACEGERGLTTAPVTSQCQMPKGRRPGSRALLPLGGSPSSASEAPVSFLKEGGSSPASIPPLPQLSAPSISAPPPHCSAKILADCKAEPGWVHRWPLILNEHLLCAEHVTDFITFKRHKDTHEARFTGWGTEAPRGCLVSGSRNVAGRAQIGDGTQTDGCQSWSKHCVTLQPKAGV